jgi:hypothetical protein
MPTGPIPESDGALITWLPRFSTGFAQHGPTLDYTVAEITAVQEDCAALLYEIQHRVAQAKAYSREVHAFRDLIKDGPTGAPLSPAPTPGALPTAPAAVDPGVMPRLRLLVQAFKNNPKYTEPMGADLDILAAEPDGGVTAPRLTLVRSVPGDTTIKWTKDGKDGVKAQSRKPGEPAWTDLGTDIYSPFVDTRPPTTPGVPETMEYRMCHLDGDTPTNVWSQILTVTKEG